MRDVDFDGDDYLTANATFHAGVYQDGYGVAYPESHVIRCYEQVLRKKQRDEGSRRLSLLDFGCGTGVHCVFFRDQGFEVFGVDSESLAIEKCRQRMPKYSENFLAIDPRPTVGQRFFSRKFDVILSNQTLYYLSDSDLGVCIQNLHDHLSPGGIVIASAMATRHHFFKRSKPARDGLRRIDIDQTDEPTACYINFVDSKEELRRWFAPFECLHVGHYDFTIRESEESRLHYLFIGRRRPSPVVGS